MRFKRWLGCLGGGGCFSRHRGAGDSNAAARAASAAESAAEAAVRKAEAVVRKAEAASSAAVRKAEAAVRKAEAAAAEELAVSSILDRWDRKIPVPEIAPLPPAAPIDDAIAKEVKSEELDATNLKDDANSNTNVMEIQVELVEAEQFVEVLEESLDGAGESEGEDEEVVYVIDEGEEAAEGGDPVKVNDSDDDDDEVEVQDVVQKCEESAKGCELVKVNGQEMCFDGGRYSEAEDGKEVLDDVSEEGEEAAEYDELVKVNDPGMSFDSGRDCEAEDEKEVLDDVSEEGEEAGEYDEPVKVNGQEGSLVGGGDSEVEEEAAKQEEEEEDVIEEGKEAAEGGDPVKVNDSDDDDEEEVGVEDVIQKCEESAKGCELVKVNGQEMSFDGGRDSEAEDGKEVLYNEPVKVNGQEMSFDGCRDSEAEDEKEVLDDVSEEGEEAAEYDEPVKVNGQEGSLVGGGDSEAEEEVAKQEAEDVSEGDKEGVKGGKSSQNCLLCVLDSKNEDISLAEWGNSEDEECSFASEEDVLGAEAGDQENNLVQWGDSEQEGGAIEYCEDAEKVGQSIDVCNGDSGVLDDWGDGKCYLIDGGEGEYEEDEIKEEVHHEVVKEDPKSKQVGVFFVRSDSDRDPTEADVVRVLNVKVLKETLFFMDPITKTNRGFAFVNEAVFFMDPIMKNTEGFAYLQCAPDDEAKAKIGVCVLSDPLVNGTPCNVAPSQDREPDEEIMVQMESQKSDA